MELRNNCLKIGLSATGTLQNICLSAKEFNFLGSPAKINLCGQNPELVAEKKEANALKLLKEEKFARIKMEEKFSLKKDVIEWEIEIINLAHSPREIAVDISLPICEKGSWRYWVPGMLSEEEIQGNIKYDYRTVVLGGGIGVPALHLSNPKKGVGIGLAFPLGQKIPNLSFDVFEGEFETVKVNIKNLLLPSSGKRKITLQIKPHPGNWEIFWDWFTEENKKALSPEDKRILQAKGSWCYLGGSMGYPDTGRLSVYEEVEDWILKENTKIYQIHLSFPYAGKYYVKESSWEDTYGGVVKEEEIKEIIRRCHRHGMKAAIYTNVNDIHHKYGEEQFPDSIARDINGEPMRMWWNEKNERQQCVLANLDPRYSFGQDLLRQIEALMKKFSEVDIVFFDQAHITEIDYAHQDGHTMVNGKPVYYIPFGVEKFMEEASRLVHRRGKMVVINAVSSIEIARFADGLVLDVGVWGAKQHRFMGWYKPVWRLCGGLTHEDMEIAIKWKMFLGVAKGAEKFFKRWNARLYGKGDKNG